MFERRQINACVWYHQLFSRSSRNDITYTHGNEAENAIAPEDWRRHPLKSGLRGNNSGHREVRISTQTRGQGECLHMAQDILHLQIAGPQL